MGPCRAHLHSCAGSPHPVVKNRVLASEYARTCTGGNTNALLIGKPGTGKSHIAKAVAYHAVQQGLKVAYLEADSDFARYALLDARERELMLQRLLGADVLVLDDLFLARRVSEAAAELLQTLVHQRHRGRPVCL